MNNPLAMYSGDMMTVNVNLSGLPAIVIRGGHVENEGTLLPVGLQIVGRPFGYELLIFFPVSNENFSLFLESQTYWI